MKVESTTYYPALGRFVHLFAKVEVTFHLIFSRILDIDQQKAQAIKRGMSSKELIAIMRAALPDLALDEQARNRLIHAFDHFGHISALRHAILHRGADASGAWLLSSNSVSALNSDGYEELWFTLDDLDAAAYDLFRMQFHLLAIAERQDGSNFQDHVPIPDLYEPWRYTRIEPEYPYRELTRKPPKPTRPPKPFRA